MFYNVTLKTDIRVPPSELKKDIEEVVRERLIQSFESFISQEIGYIISIDKINSIGEGIIIPEDGAAYYETEFTALIFKPELQEVVFGKVTDITNFGAFINMGPIEGMVHISQTMDDFVSFSKEKVLQGKKSNHSIKVGDKCRARIIAVSYKDISNPKIGLTMRQEGLGKLEWSEQQKPAVKGE